MASTRDIRRRIKSVKNTRQITKAMELVAASKMKKAQQAALASQPYAQVMGRMLGALANRVEESSHPFLEVRQVKTRGILLVTTDKGLAGPLNANLFKLVTEIKTPAKYYAIGRKGSQFLARTHRDMVADFSVSDRVSFAEVKVAVEFMVKQFLEGVIDTIEVIYPQFRNTLVQEPTLRPILPLADVKQFLASLKLATDEVFFIPGVDRARVQSLWTPNTRFSEVTESGITAGDVIPSGFEPSPEGLARVRENVLKANIVGRLVANDFTGAISISAASASVRKSGRTVVNTWVFLMPPSITAC